MEWNFYFSLLLLGPPCKWNPHVLHVQIVLKCLSQKSSSRCKKCFKSYKRIKNYSGNKAQYQVNFKSFFSLKDFFLALICRSCRNPLETDSMGNGQLTGPSATGLLYGSETQMQRRTRVQKIGEHRKTNPKTGTPEYKLELGADYTMGTRKLNVARSTIHK